MTFEGGRPVAVNGVSMDLPALIAAVTAVGGRHGFGRVDMIENRLVGIKSRELYEVPGALALLIAHRDLEDLTLERDLAHEKAGLERRWAELCYYGQWHGPLHAALRAFMADTQAPVTGEVRLRLFGGSCSVVGRRSPLALYDEALATYDGSRDRFDHSLAAGFVALWSLPLRVWGERESGPSPRLARPPAHGLVASGPEGDADVVRCPCRARSDGPGPDAFGRSAVPRDAGPPDPCGPAGSMRGAGGQAMAFTRSLGFDRRLLQWDLRAHGGTCRRARRRRAAGRRRAGHPGRLR